MLGLIRGRKAGLGCDEPTVDRLRVLAAAIFVSCFFGPGPGGEGRAVALKFGVVDPETGWSDDFRARMMGVDFAELLPEVSFNWIPESTRSGTDRSSVAGSGRVTSSIGSSSPREIRLA